MALLGGKGLIAKSLALHQPQKGSSCNFEFNLPDFSLKNWSVTSLLHASFIANSLALHQPQKGSCYSFEFNLTD